MGVKASLLMNCGMSWGFINSCMKVVLEQIQKKDDEAVSGEIVR